MGVIVIPAIDLMGGKAVRLLRGERTQVTTYADDPVAVVRRFADAGARRIHVVDLDGAFAGAPAQQDAIAAMTEAAVARGVAIQTGGGIRSANTVEALLRLGVDAVVVGTLAVREPEVVRALCGQHPGRIVVAADSRDGKVAVSGWQERVDLDAPALARAAEAWGAAAILHTDVARDGMQTGPAVQATAALQAAVSIPVYASGGVGSLADLDACAHAGLAGVVLGRALYEGAFSLEEALARC
jgi:phosphoribosylformimino-5-aminoimidazole carboxamide ribotide isomerase